MPEVGQVIEIWRYERKRWDFLPDITDDRMQIRVRVKIAVSVKNPVEEFASVNEDPIEVGQCGENDAPFEFPPPKDKENNGGRDDEQMVTDPYWAFEIGLGRVIGEVGELVEEPV